MRISHAQLGGRGKDHCQVLAGAQVGPGPVPLGMGVSTTAGKPTERLNTGAQ